MSGLRAGAPVRIVLDTNVALSALLWRGTPYRLLQSVRRQTRVWLFTSPILLEELADVQLRQETFTDPVAEQQRRIQLVSQLRDVVSDMTDRMIARLNSNSFIRVYPLLSALIVVRCLYGRSNDGFRLQSGRAC